VLAPRFAVIAVGSGRRGRKWTPFTLGFCSKFAANPPPGHTLAHAATAKAKKLTVFSPARLPARPYLRPRPHRERRPDVLIQVQTGWRRCMGVEPTLDQEAGRATVLKTVEQVLRRAPGCPRQVTASSNLGYACAWLGRASPPFFPVWQQIWQQLFDPTEAQRSATTLG
jgi:hypothetical protein